MKLIKPSFEILSQEEGLSGIYKMIEVAGRTCYKSEDKITEDSSIKFVQMLIDRGHTAMLEHGTVYLKIPNNLVGFYKYVDNKYSKVTSAPEHAYFCITTNYRVLVENGWLHDLRCQCEPTEYHEKRIAVRFICDRGVSHELVRHRTMSFAQESTRYCNYSNDKFGNELTFIIPCWLDIKEDNYSNQVQVLDKQMVKNNLQSTGVISYMHSLADSEKYYLWLSEDMKWQPQQARSVLPNSLKTEVIVTGFVSDWKHFFDLRCNEAAHPQMRELAIPLQEQFKLLKFI